jgi:hypothetical protein
MRLYDNKQLLAMRAIFRSKLKFKYAHFLESDQAKADCPSKCATSGFIGFSLAGMSPLTSEQTQSSNTLQKPF